MTMALKRHLYTTPSYKEAGFHLSEEDLADDTSMLPCWRIDTFYNSGHQPYKELAIELAGLHINDPKWPPLMNHMLCQNEEIIEIASYFQPSANMPKVHPSARFTAKQD